MNVWEKRYKRYGFASQRRYPNEALIGFLATHYFPIKERSKIKILELGCGSGANLWMVAREGFDTYGIDNAPTGLKLCKKMLDSWEGGKTHLSLGDMRKLEFEDEFFDLIFDIVSMQHINLEGHHLAYKEAFRCLKQGGRFFQWHLGTRSTSFLKSDGKHIDKSTIDNIENPNVPFYQDGLICFLTSTEVKELLRSSGFKDITIEARRRTYKNMMQIIEYLQISAKKHGN